MTITLSNLPATQLTHYFTYKLTMTINLATYLLKHFCGEARVYFKVRLLCIPNPMGSGAGIHTYIHRYIHKYEHIIYIIYNIYMYIYIYINKYKTESLIE